LLDFVPSHGSRQDRASYTLKGCKVKNRKCQRPRNGITYYRSRHSTSRITFTIFLRISKTSVLEFFRN
jgi:hypothetical protein